MTRSSSRPARPRLRLKARWRLALRGRWALGLLFAGSVLESTVLPWPIEIPMLAYMLRGRRQTVIVTLVVSAGSASGCFLAYWAGAAALDALQGFIASRPGLEAGVTAAQARVEALGPAAVFFAMLAPVPVQVASFAAGAAGMGAAPFLLAAGTGRTLRYAAMGVIVYAFGPAIMDWWARRPVSLRRFARWAVLAVFLAVFAWGVSGLLPLS